MRSTQLSESLNNALKGHLKSDLDLKRVDFAMGILFRHALKGLDLVNIKHLPERYILKRWTRDARSGIIQDMNGREIVENPKLDATLWYKNLCKIFIPLASRAADFEDCYLLVEETLHTASKQVEEKIKGTSNINAENSSVQETFSLPEQYTQVAALKKKEKSKGGSKRKKSWTEKFQKKKKKKGNKNNISKPMQQEDGSHVPESQAYESISSFTQILMVCL